MGKHKDQGTSASIARPTQAKLAAPDATDEKPADTSAFEKVVADALADVVKPTPLPPEAPTPTLGTSEPPAEPTAIPAPAAAAAAGLPPGSTPRARLPRLTRLAAMLAVAAALGALAGAFGSTMLVQPPSALASDATSATTDEIRAVKAMVGNLDRDLAGLKAGLDAAGKTTNAQLARVGERLDRVERAQSEPTAKLAKISEAVDRLERRGVASATAETTGSISPARPAAAEPNPPAKSAVVEGWVLRNVYHGVALVQGRYGVIEIEPGDTVPGLGRVETVKRQDGRWVVVTSKGLIVTR